MAQPIKGKGRSGSVASFIGKLHGSASEAKSRAAADAAQRKSAGVAPRSIILRPDEVHGEYDAARVLTTTLGGVHRPITTDDLASFRQNIRTVQRSLKGGIRVRQVLDLSLPSDRERARSQIHMAVPAIANNGKVRFVTSAGPDSDVSRHHVTVEFLGFGAAASAGRSSAKQMAAFIRKEPIKFDCDCGRHRYFLRYISTIGGFNAGRAETGFPKITNPRLVGVACKHVLRVMAEIESSAGVLNFLTKLIERSRASDDSNARLRNTQKDAEALAEKQGKRVRDIKTSDDRQKDRDAARARKALSDALKKAPPPKKKAASTRKASATDKAAALLAKQFNMTPEQLMGLLASQSKG